MERVELPAAPVKPPHYELVVVHDKVAYVSGQVSRLTDGIIAGHLEESDDITQACEAARVSVRRCLSILQQKLGSLDKIERILMLRGYISAAANFKRHPEVMDAASKVLIDCLGERAAHARCALGVSSIPGGGLTEIEMTVAIF